MHRQHDYLLFVTNWGRLHRITCSTSALSLDTKEHKWRILKWSPAYRFLSLSREFPHPTNHISDVQQIKGKMDLEMQTNHRDRKPTETETNMFFQKLRIKSKLFIEGLSLTLLSDECSQEKKHCANAHINIRRTAAKERERCGIFLLAKLLCFFLAKKKSIWIHHILHITRNVRTHNNRMIGWGLV